MPMLAMVMKEEDGNDKFGSSIRWRGGAAATMVRRVMEGKEVAVAGRAMIDDGRLVKVAGNGGLG